MELKYLNGSFEELSTDESLEVAGGGVGIVIGVILYVGAYLVAGSMPTPPPPPPPSGGGGGGPNVCHAT